MKYIRAQNGKIYSVSQLMPPCRGRVMGEDLWRLSLVTLHGTEWVYATYSEEAIALDVYRIVEAFITSRHAMITFGIGDNGLPNKGTVILETVQRILDKLDGAIEAEEETDDTTGSAD